MTFLLKQIHYMVFERQYMLLRRLVITIYYCFFSLFRGNIPGSRIADGEVLCEYLPPVPAQGTGFHRFVFCLLEQSGKLDLGNVICRNGRYVSDYVNQAKHGEINTTGTCRATYCNILCCIVTRSLVSFAYI